MNRYEPETQGKKWQRIKRERGLDEQRLESARRHRSLERGGHK